MGKNKKKNQYRGENTEPAVRENKGAKREASFTGRDDRQEPQYNPVACLLRDAISDQIETFLEGDPTEAAAANLFNLGSYPARLTGCEGAEDYEAFQLDRSVRLNRDDPSKLNRLSTIIVVQNIATHRPAFLVQAFISPNRTARVIVHEQTENGTNYRNTLRWSLD